MRNTGYKQAKIAKRVTWPSSLPINEEDEIIELIEKKLDETDKEFQERKKQAILLLKGEKNPNSNKLKIVDRFNVGDNIQQYQEGGVDVNSETRIYAPDECPVENIKPSPKPEPEPSLPPYKKYPLEMRWIEVDPSYDTNGTGYAVYSKDWDSGLSALPLTQGGDLTLGGHNRGTYYTRRIGEYEWTLENWKMVINETRAYKDYIVNQALLDTSGVPMTESESAYKNGCYFYNGFELWNMITRGLGVFKKEDVPNSTKNQFINNKYILHWNVDENGYIYEDPKAIMMRFEPSSGTMWNVHRTSSTSKFAWYRMIGQPNIGAKTDYQEVKTGADTDMNPATWGATTSLLVVVSDDGTSMEDLQKIIQVERGNSFTGWQAPKDDIKISGWSLPRKEDFEQLFGMSGGDLSVNNLFKNFFVSPNDEVPWIKSWNISNISEDILGSRLIPCGHKINNNLQGSVGGDNNPGLILGFGNRAAFATYSDPNQNWASPTLWISQSPQTVEKDQQGNTVSRANVVYDVANGTVPSSIQYWQRHARFCRNLTDEELGYKMWRKDSTDEILITPLSRSQPAGTQEIPRGLLRGLAVRWFDDRDKPTKVLVPLSILLSEVEKCKNNGGYGWFGWEWGL